MSSGFIKIANGQTVARADMPRLTFEEFRRAAVAKVKDGARVVHFFAYADAGEHHLMAVLRDSDLWAAGCTAPEAWPALTAECEPFHLFEREIAEQYGLLPQGHPWFKMVRYHPNYAGRPDRFGNDYQADIPGNYDYYAVKGEEIHEVAVGPVHAGVIEPGHFRFNCIGERVLHLEIQLGYQHRGVEPLMLTCPPAHRALVAESIAGDTAVGHSLCMAQAIESLTGTETDAGARIIRTIALELERIANHVGDLGALSGDVAFLPPANYCGRMRGDFLNMTLWICGNRFGKGLVRPGGVRYPITNEDRKVLLERLADLKPQVAHTIDLLFSTPSVRARFDGCGAVSRSDAEALGLVGPAGRACGLTYDVRRAFPNEHYATLELPEHGLDSGDVYARARIRADEILQSMALVEEQLSLPIETHCVAGGAPADLPGASFTVTLNEGWRGEVSHCVLTDARGNLLRYKIKDPSFHNWNGLAMALRDTGISDFPLNNKSFNLSYCGYDL